MISSVQDYPISHYFNPDANQRYYIPKYQREYVWRRDNWEALFNDLEDAPVGHFLGSIICVNKQSDALAGSRLELIDGQQRFTTISLLFCALYRKLSELPDPDDDLSVELINLKNRLFIRPGSDWRFEPSDQANNRADLQRVLSENFPKLVQAPKGLSNFGNRRIAKAYNYFCDRLADMNKSKLMDVLNRLKAAVLVKIEVPSHSDAFILFETINNRGIPLSAIDIIKNNLLAELEKHSDYGIERASSEWHELIDQLPEAALQERFLRHLYNAFRYLRRVQVRNCPRATRSNLITIYDSLIKKRPIWLFGELRAKAKTYVTLTDSEEARRAWGARHSAGLRDLQHQGAAPAYMFLMWVSQVAQSQGWDEGKAIGAASAYLSKWFFWRNLTDVPNTRELDQMFIDLINKSLAQIRDGRVNDIEGLQSFVSHWLTQRAAPEALCAEKLEGDIYTENVEATRFLLTKIEEAHQTRERTVDLWAIGENGKAVFSVEHILPKTENLGKKWVEMLEEGTDDEADDIRERCAHQLGNLTLSGYNSKLGTMDFVRKRDRKNDEGDYIGYRNGLYLNKDVANRDDWTERAIKSRTTKLLKEARLILSIRDPS